MKDRVRIDEELLRELLKKGLDIGALEGLLGVRVEVRGSRATCRTSRRPRRDRPQRPPKPLRDRKAYGPGWIILEVNGREFTTRAEEKSPWFALYQSLAWPGMWAVADLATRKPLRTFRRLEEAVVLFDCLNRISEAVYGNNKPASEEK